MLNQLPHSVLGAIIAYRYKSGNPFDATVRYHRQQIDINQHSINVRDIYPGGYYSIYLIQDGHDECRVESIQQLDSTLLINLDGKMVYEAHQIHPDTWLLLWVGKNSIYNITALTVKTQTNQFEYQLTTCRGDNFQITPTDNLWMSLMIGVHTPLTSVYSVQYQQQAIWLSRSNCYTRLMFATSSPKQKIFKLTNLDQSIQHTLYRYPNNCIATLVSEYPSKTCERDVMVTRNTIKLLKPYTKYQLHQQDSRFCYR